MSSTDARIDSSFDAAHERTTIRIIGEIDYTTADHLSTTLDRAWGPATGRHLFVDLIDVTFLGSAGLSLLVHAKRYAVEAGRTIAVVTGTNHAVLRPLEVSGMRQLFPIFESYADAETAAGRPS